MIHRLFFLLLIPVLVLAEEGGLIYAGSRVLFREIMDQGDAILKVADRYDQEVVKVGIDLISSGSPKQELKTFSTSFEYSVVVTGQPSKIADLDVRVFQIGSDGSTLLVAEDKDEGALAEADFIPAVGGTYIIQIIAYKMKPGCESDMGYYFLMVAHSKPIR